MSNNEDCCLARILHVIDVLQKNAEDVCNNEEGCSRGFLGPTGTTVCFNTRPVSFYTKDGSLFTVEFTSGDVTGSSSVFRVENVEGCCATCRVLRQNNANHTFLVTNNFVTVNLRCMCVVRCHKDQAIENL